MKVLVRIRCALVILAITILSGSEIGIVATTVSGSVHPRNDEHLTKSSQSSANQERPLSEERMSTIWERIASFFAKFDTKTDVEMATLVHHDVGIVNAHAYLNRLIASKMNQLPDVMIKQGSRAVIEMHNLRLGKMVRVADLYEACERFEEFRIDAKMDPQQILLSKEYERWSADVLSYVLKPKETNKVIFATLGTLIPLSNGRHSISSVIAKALLSKNLHTWGTTFENIYLDRLIELSTPSTIWKRMGLLDYINSLGDQAKPTIRTLLTKLNEKGGAALVDDVAASAVDEFRNRHHEYLFATALEVTGRTPTQVFRALVEATSKDDFMAIFSDHYFKLVGQYLTFDVFVTDLLHHLRTRATDNEILEGLEKMEMRSVYATHIRDKLLDDKGKKSTNSHFRKFTQSQTPKHLWDEDFAFKPSL